MFILKTEILRIVYIAPKCLWNTKCIACHLEVLLALVDKMLRSRKQKSQTGIIIHSLCPPRSGTRTH